MAWASRSIASGSASSDTRAAISSLAGTMQCNLIRTTAQTRTGGPERRGGNHCCGSAPRVSARAARKCASAPARQGKCAHTFSSPTCTHSPEFADELGDGAGAGDWVGEGAEPEPEPEPEPADDGAGADIGDAVTL